MVAIIGKQSCNSSLAKEGFLWDFPASGSSNLTCIVPQRGTLARGS